MKIFIIEHITYDHYRFADLLAVASVASDVDAMKRATGLPEYSVRESIETTEGDLPEHVCVTEVELYNPGPMHAINPDLIDQLKRTHAKKKKRNS